MGNKPVSSGMLVGNGGSPRKLGPKSKYAAYLNNQNGRKTQDGGSSSSAALTPGGADESTFRSVDSFVDNDPDTPSEGDEEAEPRAFHGPRRAAISAEATGVHNPRRAGKMPPNYPKTPEQETALRAALKACPFFTGLENDAMEMLVGAMPLQDIPAGEKIIQQGTQGSEAFVLLSGECYICDEDGHAQIYNREEEKTDEQEALKKMSTSASMDSDKILPAPAGRVGVMKSGRFFGEIAMLWGATRTVSVIAKEPCVLAKLENTDYTDVVILRSIAKRDQREECLRRVKLLETLQDEQVTVLADAFELQVFEEGTDIIVQGSWGHEFFVVQTGECAAIVRTGASDSSNGAIDEQEHRRYGPGELFGERALLQRTYRAATVKALCRTEVLVLNRRKFERLLGSLSELGNEHYLTDPRKDIADYYRKGDVLGPDGSRVHGDEAIQAERDRLMFTDGVQATDWFSVYRPTSRDAISKMLSGNAVGKGLNVKGKSAKKGRLSGFVPFLQIHDNKHKEDIEDSPEDSWFEVYYTDPASRQQAKYELMKAVKFLREEKKKGKSGKAQTQHHAHHHGTVPKREHKDSLQLDDIDEYIEASAVYGLDVPEQALRKVYIDDPDLSFLAGWETGRNSEPAFMDMNFHSLRDGKEPKVVLFQVDKDDPMNPQGLLIAYAEHKVKPVVSDFDTFLVGSRGVIYEEIPKAEIQLSSWSLDMSVSILESPDHQSWTSRWLEILKVTGKTVETPKYGFGDPLSIRLISEVIRATIESGGVRHGAECFNFFMCQELDDEYLVVWECWPDKPWAYMKEEELRGFLLERVAEGFSFPLNPVWLVRDPGWYQVYEALQGKLEAAINLVKWFPQEVGIMEKIEAIHKRFPDGFRREDSPKAPLVQHSDSRVLMSTTSQAALRTARSKLAAVNTMTQVLDLHAHEHADFVMHQRNRPHASLKAEEEIEKLKETGKLARVRGSFYKT